jgi:hypothetical protein
MSKAQSRKVFGKEPSAPVPRDEDEDPEEDSSK